LAPTFHVAHQLDALAGAVAAGAGQHRHLARRLFDHELDDPQLLAV
jgi:hypothetical protein